MASDEATWTELKGMISTIRDMADDITIVVVANTKSAFAGDDAPGDRLSEYLSDNEAAQLMTGLSEAGFRTRYVEGELRLIQDMLADRRMGIRSRLAIVYNIAQSGSDAGRKSLIPAFCALTGMPVCNSGSFAVSLARNKMHVNAALRRFGLPTPDTWAYSAKTGRWIGDERPPGGMPLIVKACHESSSVGLDCTSVGTMTDDFLRRLHGRSVALAQPVVVQPLIEGGEFEVPLVELRPGEWHALGPAVVTLDGDDRLGARILDFETVATDAYEYVTPLPRHDRAAALARSVAGSVAEILGLNGFARVDFRTDAEGCPYVTDVSTSPHLVLHSAFSHVFRAAGVGHDDMMAAMVAVNARRLGWLPSR